MRDGHQTGGSAAPTSSYEQLRAARKQLAAATHEPRPHRKEASWFFAPFGAHSAANLEPEDALHWPRLKMGQSQWLNG